MTQAEKPMVPQAYLWDEMPVIFVPEKAYRRLLKLAEEKEAAGVEDLILSLAADDMGSQEAAGRAF